VNLWLKADVGNTSKCGAVVIFLL